MNRVRRIGALLATAVCGLAASGGSLAVPPVPQAFTGCLIYADADSPPIKDGTIVIEGTKIAALGPGEAVKLPKRAAVVPCDGGAILPGFWNAHVHFTEPSWEDAANSDADKLKQHLADKYLRYGFVALVDTGSILANTRALADRAKRDFIGPRILTAGSPFVAPNGTPFYVEGFKFPELVNAEQAREVTSAALDQGADAIKLMTVSLTRQTPYPAVSLEAVRAAAETAHARGKRVLAHPTNRQGVELAVEGGVDVLLHTAPIGGPWDDAMVKRMIEADVSLVPTLALWDHEAAKTGDEAIAKRFREISAQQVRAFAEAGGRILFGTDVGYMPKYDPTDEYLAMQAAGMTFSQILASLTKNPIEIFEAEPNGGRLTVGANADFVLVDGDPAEDIRELAQVRRTYIAGRPAYTRRP